MGLVRLPMSKVFAEAIRCQYNDETTRELYERGVTEICGMNFNNTSPSDVSHQVSQFQSLA